KRSIETELRKFTVLEDFDAPLPEVAPVEVETLEAQFIKQCKIVTLPATAYFRTGQTGATWPLVGPYRAVSNEKTQLEAITQKMHNLVKHIDERTKAICSGNLKAENGCHSLDDEKALFERAVSELERDVRKIQSGLYRREFSKKVHAPL